MARKSLGPRVTITVKTAQPYWDKFVALAEDRGLTRQELGHRIITAYLDNEPLPDTLINGQQELPMTG